MKDLSLEIPNAPTIFLERETHEINMQLGGKNQTIEESLYEVLLTVKKKEKKHKNGEEKRRKKE